MGVGVSLGVFLLALAATSFAAPVLTGKDTTWHKGDTWVVIAYAAWALVYFAHSWAERQDGRDGDVPRAGRARRRHRGKRAPGGRWRSR